MKFYAHSGTKSDQSDWQVLSDHLNSVATLSKAKASAFGAEEMAFFAGLLHDLGKYSIEFQNRLNGSSLPADHSTAGAKVAVELWGKLGYLIAFVIAGHHAGLANGVDQGVGRSTLISRLGFQFGKEIPVLDPIWQIDLPLQANISLPILKVKQNLSGFQFAFFIRMLYSCLVDSDFIDTDNFYRSINNQSSRPISKINVSHLKLKLDEFLSALETKAIEKNNSPLNILRSEILASVKQKAILEKGLFSLTVPTGGGKTFASMSFALDHAYKHNLRRVIYVIPYTSIIEQNAQVFRSAFGELGESAVLEHHSSFNESAIQSKNAFDKLKTASENWDAPVIVTTSVQFFESLFADKSSRCRKLHNIAESVIIFDEAQNLPLKLIRPILASIDELSRNYRCSLVLCTATQPTFDISSGMFNGLENVRELAPNPQFLFDSLRRVRVKNLGILSDDELQNHLLENKQVLMIVNNRRQARKLFDGIKHIRGARHLTTLMCAKHRSIVLEEVKQDLIKGLPCRLISTSLVEAGVDIDFPTVFRAETGLDSIAQAAGRCNREGKRDPSNSMVFIFETDKKIWRSPPELEQAAFFARSAIRNNESDPLSIKAITEYFQALFKKKGKELDAKNILKMHEDHADTLLFPFQKISSNFEMIESVLQPVIIDYDSDSNKLINELRFSQSALSIARGLQRYLVQIPKRGYDQLLKAGCIEIVESEKFGNQFCILTNNSLYNATAGLSWDNPTFLDAENLVL